MIKITYSDESKKKEHSLACKLNRLISETSRSITISIIVIFLIAPITEMLNAQELDVPPRDDQVRYSPAGTVTDRLVKVKRDFFRESETR